MLCCHKFTIKLNVMSVGAGRCAYLERVSTIGAMIGRVSVSKGQGNARGSREGRLPVVNHPPRLSV